MNESRNSSDGRVDLVEIDLATVGSKQELHDVLAGALGFPGFYGGNWDAFWDAITRLVLMPKRLRLTGWHQLEQRLPRDAELMKMLLEDMAREYPDEAPAVEYQ